MVGMILDTTFLIDLQRETRRDEEGPTIQFLQKHPDESLSLSAISVGEFSEGYPETEMESCRTFLRPFRVLPLNEEIAYRYGQISRRQRQQGNRTGDNDLWIAATALAHNAAFVTRNVEHFCQIPHLQMLGY
jgi:tRNA(fMet)-specific endonuclease VapC